MKNLEQYVGRKVKGVKFEDSVHKGIGYLDSMKEFEGYEGVITKYDSDIEAFKVSFTSPREDYWFYPVKVLLPQLGEEVKGYLIKDKKYQKIIAKLAGVDEDILSNTFSDGVHFYVGSFLYDTVVECDLLDKCTPVFRDKAELPIINGHRERM